MLKLALVLSFLALIFIVDLIHGLEIIDSLLMHIDDIWGIASGNNCVSFLTNMISHMPRNIHRN